MTSKAKQYKAKQNKLEKSATMSIIVGLILAVCTLFFFLFSIGGTTNLVAGLSIGLAFMVIMVTSIILAAIAYGKLQQYKTLYRHNRNIISEDDASRVISRYFFGILLSISPLLVFFLFLI